MATYRTTRIVHLPAPYYAGAEVEYLGWPKAEFALEPLDDEARAIDAWYRANVGTQAIPTGPYVNGRLSLPLIGPPIWRLGATYREQSKHGDNIRQTMYAAIGPFVMGANRSPFGTFSSIEWPADDVEPVNEQARLVAVAAARFAGHDLPSVAWDSTRQCVNEPIAA
jgi:hypothetical protein